MVYDDGCSRITRWADLLISLQSGAEHVDPQTIGMLQTGPSSRRVPVRAGVPAEASMFRTVTCVIFKPPCDPLLDCMLECGPPHLQRRWTWTRGRPSARRLKTSTRAPSCCSAAPAATPSRTCCSRAPTPTACALPPLSRILDSCFVAAVFPE